MHVKGTINRDILYKKKGECNMIGYFDAHYARKHDIWRSTIGFVFHLNSKGYHLAIKVEFPFIKCYFIVIN